MSAASDCVAAEWFYEELGDVLLNNEIFPGENPEPIHASTRSPDMPEQGSDAAFKANRRCPQLGTMGNRLL